MASKTKIRLHLSDWNMQDKYYDVPIDILREFREKIRNASMESAWDWFVNQGIDYTSDHSEDDKPIKCLDLDWDVFLDYTSPQECVEEWDPDLLEED